MSYPVLYGQQVAIWVSNRSYSGGDQSNSYSGWLGITSSSGCTSGSTRNNPNPRNSSNTAYTSPQAWIVNSYNNQYAPGTPVHYQDQITLTQANSNNVWYVDLSCHDEDRIGVGTPTPNPTAVFTMNAWYPSQSGSFAAPIWSTTNPPDNDNLPNASYFIALPAQHKNYPNVNVDSGGLYYSDSTHVQFSFFIMPNCGSVICPPTQTCVSNTCVTPSPGGCPSGGCPSGQSCVNNICYANSGSACSTTVLCGSGLTCTNGTCVATPSNQTCTGPGTCTGAFTCVNNICQPNCSGTGQSTCPTGSTCQQGVCLPGTCTGTNDCQANYMCQNGQCVPGCVTSSTCSPGWNCQGNQCVNPVPTAECSATQKCSFGKSCSNGVCKFNAVLPAIIGGALLVIIVIAVLASRKKKTT